MKCLQGSIYRIPVQAYRKLSKRRYLLAFTAQIVCRNKKGSASAYTLPDRSIVQPVLDGECDMCIGSRFVKKEGFQTSFMRRVGIRFLSGLIFLLSGHRVLDVTSGFRATNARMTAYFARHYAIDYPEPEAALAAILAGFKVAEAPVIMRERQGGVSSIHSFKSVYYMIKVSLALIIDRLSIRKSKGGRA